MLLNVNSNADVPWLSIAFLIVCAAAEIFHLAWTKKSATVELFKQMVRVIKDLEREVGSKQGPLILCGAWVSVALVLALASLCYVFVQSFQHNILQGTIVFGVLALGFVGLAFLLYYINHRWIVPWLRSGVVGERPEPRSDEKLSGETKHPLNTHPTSEEGEQDVAVEGELPRR